MAEELAGVEVDTKERSRDEEDEESRRMGWGRDSDKERIRCNLKRGVTRIVFAFSKYSLCSLVRREAFSRSWSLRAPNSFLACTKSKFSSELPAAKSDSCL